MGVALSWKKGGSFSRVFGKRGGAGRGSFFLLLRKKRGGPAVYSFLWPKKGPPRKRRERGGKGKESSLSVF